MVVIRSCWIFADKETLQVIRNELSGWIRAYPITKLDASTLLKNLLFHPSQVANGASDPFLAFIWGPLPLHTKGV